jgi:hypothetical protein
LLFGQLDEPIDKFFAVLVMQQAVGFEAVMDVSEDCYLLE